MKSITNYIKVSKTISTAGLPTKKQFKKIYKKGFEVVINLAVNNKDALKDEDKIVSDIGMIYIHIPIDWKNPQHDRLDFFLMILKQLQKDNKKVFIHCIMNYRVSAFMHKYKQKVLKQKNIEFIKPKKFKLKKAWQDIITKKL